MINVASNIAKVTKKNSSFLCQINCRYSVKVRGLKLGIGGYLAFRAVVGGLRPYNCGDGLQIALKLLS
jgi:hypothetical protein